MEPHPACAAFPLMSEQELAALAEDICTNGLAQPIVLLAGKVLDGRNRLLACELAGIEPRVTEWSGSGSPITWVVSQNLHRRHLDASQRAMVGAALVPLFAAEAKERQRAAGGAHPGAVPANLPEAGEAREKAAEAVNVSPRSVENALRVVREAKPEVIEAVKRGDVAVSAAAKALPTKRVQRPKHSKKDEDWNVTLTLVLPHSAVPALTRLLAGAGFRGGSNRKMKLHDRAALDAA